MHRCEFPARRRRIVDGKSRVGIRTDKIDVRCPRPCLQCSLDGGIELTDAIRIIKAGSQLADVAGAHHAVDGCSDRSVGHEAPVEGCARNECGITPL